MLLLVPSSILKNQFMLLSENLIGVWPLCSLTRFLNCGFFLNSCGALACLAPTCCRQRCKESNWTDGVTVCAAQTLEDFSLGSSFSLSNPHAAVTYFAAVVCPTLINSTEELRCLYYYVQIVALCWKILGQKYILFALHFNFDDKSGENVLN